MVAPLPLATRQVIELSATGLTTPEVAERLGVPREEVRERIREAIVTLGARSKLEAVVIALRLALARPPCSCMAMNDGRPPID